MIKKLSGFSSSGNAQPQNTPKTTTPYFNECWKDGRGCRVTVIGVSFRHVRFIRDGYAHPCELPAARFAIEFTQAGEVSDGQ